MTVRELFIVVFTYLYIVLVFGEKKRELNVTRAGEKVGRVGFDGDILEIAGDKRGWVRDGMGGLQLQRHQLNRGR